MAVTSSQGRSCIGTKYLHFPINIEVAKLSKLSKLSTPWKMSTRIRQIKNKTGLTSYNMDSHRFEVSNAWLAAVEPGVHQSEGESITMAKHHKGRLMDICLCPTDKVTLFNIVHSYCGTLSRSAYHGQSLVWKHM